MENKYLEFPFADYLLVFISIIVGYVVTEFFAGWGGLIRNRGKVKIYWLHILWTFNFFFQLIENWWWLWDNRIRLADHFYNFAFTLISPLIFYLISVYLFPTVLSDESKGEVFDFKAYYYKNNRPVFLLLIVVMFTYLMNNIFIHHLPLWSNNNLFYCSGILFYATFIAIRSEKYHILGFFTSTLVFISFIVLNSKK